MKTVQILLNVNRAGWAGTEPLVVDGLAGENTCRAIAPFQARRVPAAPRDRPRFFLQA